MERAKAVSTCEKEHLVVANHYEAHCFARVHFISRNRKKYRHRRSDVGSSFLPWPPIQTTSSTRNLSIPQAFTSYSPCFFSFPLPLFLSCTPGLYVFIPVSSTLSSTLAPSTLIFFTLPPPTHSPLVFIPVPFTPDPLSPLLAFLTL